MLNSFNILNSNTLKLLLLSNAITSRRDKSIRYSRATIALLLISLFIPLWLEWSMPHFCILIWLTIGAIIYLLLIYTSSRDSTEVGQKDLKDFEPKEIYTLIDRLRSKQKEFLDYKKDISNEYKSCRLSDIDFIYRNGVVIEEGSENPENEITYMLTKLLVVKPDFFAKNSAAEFSGTSVNTICSRLRELLGEDLTNNLTEENLTILTKELKSRMQKLFKDRESEGSLSKACQLRDIHIKLWNGVLLDGARDKLENEFTRLLGKLVYEKPEFFSKSRTTRTGVKELYSKLMDLIRKPLTKDEISLIIDGLESRKDKLFENRKTIGDEDNSCKLKDFKISSCNGVIIEEDTDLATYEFTRLLENLLKEKPNLINSAHSTLSSKDVKALIKDLGKLVSNLESVQ